MVNHALLGLILVTQEAEALSRALILVSKFDLYFKKLICLFERVTEIFCLLIHSPDGCISQGWARPKSGSRSFIQVSRG